MGGKILLPNFQSQAIHFVNIMLNMYGLQVFYTVKL